MGSGPEQGSPELEIKATGSGALRHSLPGLRLSSNGKANRAGVRICQCLGFSRPHASHPARVQLRLPAICFHGTRLIPTSGMQKVNALHSLVPDTTAKTRSLWLSTGPHQGTVERRQKTMSCPQTEHTHSGPRCRVGGHHSSGASSVLPPPPLRVCVSSSRLLCLDHSVSGTVLSLDTQESAFLPLLPTSEQSQWGGWAACDRLQEDICFRS